MSVRERLPREFLTYMQELLGEETEEFLSGYEEEARTGIRVNTRKVSVREAKEKLSFVRERIPWTANGFYTEKDMPVSRHPYYYAGLYYIQEPSAMLPASRLPVEPGDVVLDLCAAPGGKATELSSRLNGSGLLVANDVSASRAKALLKNMELWGVPNSCVTAETPQRLLEAFGCCFDKILVDAPCSGEGMFRKENSLISSWEQKGPDAYAPLQKEILSCAVQMLKPGGMLLYSTCTFSLKEDEEVIAFLLDQYPEMSLVEQELSDGFAKGISLEQCIRIYPHRVKGEGHFLALLQKKYPDDSFHSDSCRQLPDEKGEGDFYSGMPDEVRDFLKHLSDRIPLTYRYKEIGEQCLLLPPYRLPRGLRYLRTGLLLGTRRRGRFEPSQALAMLLDRSAFDCVLDLAAQDERVFRYLKGETIGLGMEEAAMLRTTGEAGCEDNDGSAGRGLNGAVGKTGREMSGKSFKKRDGSVWVLVCVDGHGLGWAKLANESLKNKYYPGWRLQ
ncbi:MAG: RsmB/NOP family class I SAM-dependent RNA methyltransferase [Clostridiales bacterium]|nr:RsmB/NOP family class I SAM-dependent RNA methyltransferase [Clostridiales bacterium]